MSGGFPHSDIPGSKGALASPGLIAECHVLHRLLPPRHPPNALLALDPIQKKTGPFAWRGFIPSSPSRLASGRKSFDPRLPGSRLRRRKWRRRTIISDQTEPHGQLLLDLERLWTSPMSIRQAALASDRRNPSRVLVRTRFRRAPHRAFRSPDPEGSGQHVDIHVSCYCSLDDVKSLISRSDCTAYPWMRCAVRSFFGGLQVKTLDDCRGNHPPRVVAQVSPFYAFRRTESLVGRGGVEPPTSRLSGVRSNPLSYRP